MRTDPKTEEQINESKLIPPGFYDFLVEDAKAKYSKSGNEMIELRLKIFMPNGSERIIFDYLLAAMDFKLRHFSECTDNLAHYEADDLLPEHCMYKSGKLEIIIQKGKDNFGDRSSVKDYVADKIANAPALAAPVKNDFEDDALPF